MPLNLPATARVPSAGIVVGLLPVLPELVLVGAPPQTAREQSRAADDERRRRDKNAARESNGELTAADATLRAERNVAPGSAAFRRAEARAAAHQQALETQTAFRAHLAEAGQRAPVAGRGGSGDPDAPHNEAAAGADDSAPRSPKNAAARPAVQPQASSRAVPSPPAPLGASSRADAKAEPSSLLDLLPIDRTVTKSSPAATPSVVASSGGGALSAGVARAATPAVAASPAAASAAAEPASASVASVGRVEGASGAKSDPSLLAAADRRALADASRTASPRSAPRAGEPTGKDDANVEHIVRVVASRIGKDRSVATLRFDPAELGSIKLHMDLRDRILNLRVESESPVAHRLLVERVEALRAALQAADIRLERVEFATTAPPRDPADAGDGRDGSRPDSDAAQPEPERSGAHAEPRSGADGEPARGRGADGDVDADRDAVRRSDDDVEEPASPSPGARDARRPAAQRVNLLA